VIRGRRGNTVPGIASRSLGTGRRRGAAVACAVAVGLTACSDGGSSPSAGSATVSSSAAPSTASDSAGASSPAAAGGAATGSAPASSVPAAPPPTAAPPPAAQAMTVTATEMAFRLDDADVPAGEYTLTLTNRGRSTHDLVVEQAGDDVAGTDTINPGESTTLTVTLTPGRYVFYCSVANHRAMGMEVAVTVS
jgi:plastocyanin